ncbi:hypothetical protein Csa_015559 [Cucumis sativus]|nr:hypothetical protein Csa_015559 [Cucumis sativus]
MSDDLNNQPCTSPHHFWLTDMPVNNRSLGREENSAVPTASINIGEFGESSTGELGGRSVAESGDQNNSFDADEPLQRQEIFPRRTRFIWTDEYHRIFVEAVDRLTLQSKC